MLGEYAVVKGESRVLEPALRQKLIGLQESSLGFSALTSAASELVSMAGGKLVLERPTLEDIMLYTIRGERHD